MAKEYLQKGHTKKGYALFEKPYDKQASHWKNYFLKSVGQV